MPLPPSDDYLELLGAAVGYLSKGEGSSAEQVVERLASEYPDRLPRVSTPPAKVVAVFRRDGFRCRYCGGEVVPTPVLRAASLVWPDLIRFNLNFRADVTHPAIVTRSASIDHVRPHAHSGSSEELDNLVTACWPCNVQKGEFSLERLGWTLKDEQRDGWDGLVSGYRTLWDARQTPDTPNEIRYPSRWMKAFGV